MNVMIQIILSPAHSNIFWNQGLGGGGGGGKMSISIFACLMAIL